MIDFNNYEFSYLLYGGESGFKKGLIYNKENCFLKFSSSVEEYIGSKIYKSIKIDVQDVILGIYNKRVVVLCKDFLNDCETIFDFNMIRNDYNPEFEKTLEKLSSSSSRSQGRDINEIILIMHNNHFFKEIPELTKRFWQMFVVDALIGNNDRNEGNWGLIFDKKSGKLKLAPVYDNGASFSNKADDKKFLELLENEKKFISSAYESAICIFMENDKDINPIKYIESKRNEELNNIVLEIIPTIDLNEIKNIIYNIPNEYKGIKIISDLQKEYYYKSFEYRYSKLLNVYNILKK